MDPVVLVDEKDNIIGEISRTESHQKGLLHKVSVIYLFNDKGEILIQHRADGRLDHSSAGHVDPGESDLEAAERELFEELGIKSIPLVEFARVTTDELKPNGEHVRHRDTVYKLKAEPIKINKEEIQRVFWADPWEIWKDMKKDPQNLKYTGGFKTVLKHYLKSL